MKKKWKINEKEIRAQQIKAKLDEIDQREEGAWNR
jgi:hypothetical protein